jgi:outer membrane protein assembly factor BamB
MRFEIVVAPQPSEIHGSEPGALSGDSPAAGAAPARSARELLDVFVDGGNVTAAARIRETHGAFVLRDLALALVDLARRPRGKATVRFYDEPWELCVERFGATACLSMYRVGPEPHVAVHDRAVPIDEVLTAVRDAIDRYVADGSTRAAARVELASAAELLRGVAGGVGGGALEDVAVPEPVPVVIEPDHDAPVAFGAEFAMRERPVAANEVDAFAGADAAVEHTDLHALLFRGRLRAEIRGRSVDLGECYPVLVAERLVELARRAFDAWERGLPLYARGDVAGVLVGVRVATDGSLALTLGASPTRASALPPARRGRTQTVHTFPALGVADFLDGAQALGRSLVRAVLRRDRAQASNLRLSAFRRTLREATEALREAGQTDCKVNPTPEPYRAYAAALDVARPAPAPSLAPSRLRYVARWRAIVPGVDLRGTYLCGDRLVAGASTEMWALDRTTGAILWRADVLRGTSVVTPGGVARLAADGTLCVYDLGTGQVALRTRIAPRAGGPVAGAVVHLPGLPKLAIVTEGEHHLVAIDLTTGELRWRWSWGSSRSRAGGSGTRGAPRMKRAGRLVYFTCGDGSLTALDVMTGAVVWRVRDRLRFRGSPSVAHDALFAVAGGVHAAARLYRIDPYSGDVRWSRLLGDAMPCTVEGAPLIADGAVGVAVRAARTRSTLRVPRSGSAASGPASSVSLATFNRDDGTPIALPPGAAASSSASPRAASASSGTSWLAVDDAFIGNAPTGELVSLDAEGTLRWRHLPSQRPLEADIPRRLEPILRGGALFVPSSDGHVVMLRPKGGEVLGTIEAARAGAIPDLLRVDELGNVYIAEESGHMVAFGALPRLTLV